MARILRARDPNVTIILLVPYPVTMELQAYYNKILKMVELDEARDRIKFMIPENYVKFSKHMSMAQQVMYSPMCLNKIQELIINKNCYIVPGKVDKYDIKLSVLLSVPILAGDPAKVGHFETKSGCKEIFKKAKIPMAIGSKALIEDEDELFT